MLAGPGRPLSALTKRRAQYGSPVPLCTLMGPGDFQGHGTRRWFDDRGVSMPGSSLSVTPEAPQAPTWLRQSRQRLRRRMGRSGLVIGTSGGCSFPVTEGLRRGRYDSPSTTRS